MHTLPSSISDTIVSIVGTLPNHYVQVSISQQRMVHINNKLLLGTYPVSTSRFGIGNAENSYKTPSGIHRVVEKYGSHAPWGRIFKDRLDTGLNWDPSKGTGEDLILSRILRLEGLEEGLNKGPGIDSYERYIYIHGTCNEHRIGSPNSHGCICMTNDDVIALFALIPEGTIVVIS